MNQQLSGSADGEGRPEIVANGWMMGATAQSLVAVGPTDEIEVEFEGTSDVQLLIDLFAKGATALTVSRASGLTVAEAENLITDFRARGALVDAHAVRQPAGITPLHVALGRGAGRAVDSAEVICTAEELLVLPADVDDQVRAIAVRNFVAGLEPWGRLRAYSSLIAGRGRICGDLPQVPPAPSAIDLARFSNPTVLNLQTSGVSQSTPDELVDGGFNRAHRLGSLCREHPPQSLESEGIPDVWYTVANLACTDLADPTAPIDRRVQGLGDREHSQLCARAEGAERFAVLSAEPKRIRVASAVDLGAMIEPEGVIAFSQRQMKSRELDTRVDPAAPRPWCEAQTFRGETSWVDASIVYPHLAGRPRRSGAAARLTASSGVAAHSILDRARDSALAELIERDAFMWTWIQQLARERIDPDTVPEPTARWAHALGRQGWTTHWVNLTLETWPVVLCCLVQPAGRLVVGAACRASPAEALLRATQEAMVLALRFDVTRRGPIAAESVRHPVDHLRFYARQPPDAAQFLYSSEKLTALDDLQPSGEVIEQQLAGIGIDVHFVDVSSDHTAPFHVVRAFAPGLAPLTFGFDREPLGMAILGQPRRTSTGEKIGQVLDLSRRQMRSPHPFA